ncbi:MAG: hypothetical protein OXH75_15645 [Acidobacteria bacterium]|nr:hypothetical protein [Acidobacteriota bacterium]
MARTGDQRDRLLPKAARVVFEGGSKADAARAVGRHRSSVARWMNLPQWDREIAKLEAEHAAVLATMSEARKQAAGDRVREIEAYRDELWTHLKRVKEKADEILENNVEAKRTSKREQVKVVNPRTGEETVFDEVKLEHTDAAAIHASKMMAGGGWARLLEIAYGAPLVSETSADLDEQREERRITIAERRREVIEEVAQARAREQEAG